MEAYTYQIGKGENGTMEQVAYAQEVMADSLDEAIFKARAVTNTRAEHASEDMVCLIDASRPEGQVVWTRSTKDIRAGQ